MMAISAPGRPDPTPSQARDRAVLPTPNVAMPVPQVAERPAADRSGWAMVGVNIALLVVTIALVGIASTLSGSGSGILVALAAGAFIVSVILAVGLTPVAPGQARVVQLLGRYQGTIRTDGLRWVNPLTSRSAISTRIRNHETGIAKVNDADGNPIEIAAVVVWQVQDTARAKFEVDDFVAFVAIQTETAVRHIANSYPYEPAGEGQMSLRDNADEVTGTLSAEIAARVESAGV